MKLNFNLEIDIVTCYLSTICLSSCIAYLGATYFLVSHFYTLFSFEAYYSLFYAIFKLLQLKLKVSYLLSTHFNAIVLLYLMRHCEANVTESYTFIINS